MKRRVAAVLRRLVDRFSSFSFSDFVGRLTLAMIPVIKLTLREFFGTNCA